MRTLRDELSIFAGYQNCRGNHGFVACLLTCRQRCTVRLTAPVRIGRSAPCSPQSRLLQIVKSHPLFLLLLAAVPVVECIAAAQGGPGPSIAVVRNPFAAIALASVFCRYIIYDRAGRTRRWIVYLTPLAWLTVMAVEGRNAPLPLMWLDMLFALGVLGVCGFLLAAAVSDAEAKSRIVEQLLNALLFPLGASMVSFGLWATHRVNPVYDTRIYAFEEILGFKFSIIGVKSYHLLRPFSGLASACYAMLALAMTVVAGAQGCARREQQFLRPRHRRRRRVRVCSVFFVPRRRTADGFSVRSIRMRCPTSVPTRLCSWPQREPRATACRPSIQYWALLIWFNLRNAAGEVEDEPQGIGHPERWAVMGLDDTHWLTDVVIEGPSRRCRAVGIRALAPESRRRDDGRPHRLRGPDALVAGGDPSWLAAPRPPADAGLDHRPGTVGWPLGPQLQWGARRPTSWLPALAGQQGRET